MQNGHMDNEYRIDTGDILRTLGKAEVVVFRFVTVPQRLLIDFRHSATDAPMVKLVPRAKSAEDRFRTIKVLRPRFRLPQKISAVWWPRYIGRLSDDGIWDAIVQRMTDDGYGTAAADCDAAHGELLRMERTEQEHAIAGEGYRTLWPVTSQR